MPIDVNLVGYQGNAGLGLGTNADIPVGGGGLGAINGTLRDLMLMDNEKNVRLYNQKIKDRDALQQQILQGAVSTGEIFPDDQKYVDQSRKGVEDAFKTWGGDQNDTDGYRKYQTAVTKLQDTVTHAQTRWAGIKKLQQEKSQQTLPSRISEYDSHIKEQEAKPFGAQIDPYQQLHDFNIDDITGGVTPVVTQTDSDKPISYDVGTVDYGDVLKNKRNAYINDRDAANSMDQFSDKLSRYDQPQLKKTIADSNTRLAQYNSDRGLVEGQPGYAAPIQTHLADDGTLVIAEPATDLAAKYALASHSGGFVTRTPKVNLGLLKAQYDKAKLGIDQQKVNLEAKKVGIDQQKATAYVKHMTAATKKITDAAQQDGTDITQEYNSFIDAIKPGSVQVNTGGKKAGNLDAILLNELPAGLQYINGPVVDDKGKVTAGRLIPFSSGGKYDKKGEPLGDPYYIPKYVNPTTGEKLDLSKLPKDIQDGYDQAKKQGVSKDDYIRILLKKGYLELQLQGKNGLANYTSLAQSAKLINNQTSKKGQENVMNPPESSPNAPEETPAVDNNPSNDNPENN